MCKFGRGVRLGGVSVDVTRVYVRDPTAKGVGKFGRRVGLAVRWYHPATGFCCSDPDSWVQSFSEKSFSSKLSPSPFLEVPFADK
jgi:hypothetical protein